MCDINLLKNTIIASKDDKGNWIYKSNDAALLKSNIVLKKRELKDKPMFDVISNYENKMIEEYRVDVVNKSILEIVKKLM